MSPPSFSSTSFFNDKGDHVFPSFHGPDVRKGFLSHLHSIFARKKISMFKDQEIERGHTIGSVLVQGIREAKASIVVLSKNYASSVWCLDELLEILKCKEASGQIVIPIFYDVDPSDVRKQKGEFGMAFEKTCESETEEHKGRWIEALKCIATIAGEHSRNWNDESAMVEKVSTDVTKNLIKKECMGMDLDQNGFITAAELRYYLTKDGKNQVTDEDLSSYFLLTDVDGDGRISHDEMVNFFMARYDEAVGEKLGIDVMNKMKVEELKREFKAMDLDQNGFITAPELRYFLTKDGDKVVTDVEVSTIVQAADVDADGRISHDEFVKVMMATRTGDEEASIDKKLLSLILMDKRFATNVTLSTKEKQEMIDLFTTLDFDHDGTITAAEYQYVKEIGGQNITHKKASDYIRLFDVDGDGRVCFDEFVKSTMAARKRAEKIEKVATHVSIKVNKLFKFMAKVLS